MVGPAITALGCWSSSGELVFLGLAFCGAAQAIVLLSRAAAAEMFPPERRARGMSYVLFGAVSGAIFGPLIFGPLFSGRDLTPDELALPWLFSSLFALAGFLVSFAHDRRPEGALEGVRHRGRGDGPGGAPRRDPAAARRARRRMLGAVASFAVMVGVMNLAGYIAVGHGHAHGDVFTIISAHIVGMYGLVLVAGDLIDRIGRARSMAIGLMLMAVSNAALVWLDGIPGMSLSLFGLGLGWNLAYVAATTRARDARRAVRARTPRRLLGSHLELHRRGDRARPAESSTARADRCPSRRWPRPSRPCPPPGSCCYNPPSAGGLSAVSPYEDLLIRPTARERDHTRVVSRRRRGADPRPSRDADRRHAARQAASRSTRRTSTPATSSSS